MSTTTIRLSEELKARIAAAAEQAGQSAQNFMLEAIVEKTEMEERRAQFAGAADARFDRFVATGESIPWADMRRYLLERAAGNSAPSPTAKKTSR
ncbi:MAG TPA: CopG family transcriptional regulator [Burkholderiaceae bacterium]|nr:CopG family transcriptional regulator [Burkholderiaceae bacterium]